MSEPMAILAGAFCAIWLIDGIFNIIGIFFEDKK